MSKVQIAMFNKTRDQFHKEAPNVKLDRLDEIIIKIRRYETTLRRLADERCSLHMTTQEAIQNVKKDKRTQKKVEALATELGFNVRFNDDPRGPAIRLILPSGEHNNWDGETWSVNW